MRDTEPDPLMSCGDDGRSLILDMPPMTDEAAYQLSELLRRLCETFEEAYGDQLSRAYRKLEEERETLYRERLEREAQQSAEADDEFDNPIPF